MILNKHVHITPSNGYLGSRTDEERSELRDVMRIADVRESSNLWTQLALGGPIHQVRAPQSRYPHRSSYLYVI